MIGHILSIAMLAGPGYADCLRAPPQARELCIQRKVAHDRGEFGPMHGLIDEEVHAVQAQLDRTAGISAGDLEPLCLPLDAGFNVACERQDDLQLAKEYLDRYREIGCLRDPLQRPRWHTNQAMYFHRRLDDARALKSLERGDSATASLILAYWFTDRRARLLWNLANSTAVRAEIAANLRHPEVLQTLVERAEALLGDVEDARHRDADVRNLLGWSVLMAHEAGLAVEDPTPLFTSALKTFEGDRANTGKATNTHINLALAASQRRSLDSAQRWIDEIDDEHLRDEGLLWLRIIQVRVALARGDIDKSEAWQADLDRLGQEGRIPLAAWFAKTAEGRRRVVMHDLDPGQDLAPAIRAYAEAEEELEEYATKRPDGTNAMFAARRHLTYSAPTQELVSLLVDAGDSAGALEVVRRSRSRAIRIASQKKCEESFCTPIELRSDPAPPPRALRLVYFQVSRSETGKSSDWIGFAVTQGPPRAVRIKLAPITEDLLRSEAALAELSQALLAPFAEELADARSVEFLATGRLHQVPFHALPWGGAPLIHHLPVMSSLDLARAQTPEPNLGGGVLVLHGDDPPLRDQATDVLKIVRRSGHPSRQLEPRTPEELQLIFDENAANIAHIAAHGLRPSVEGLLMSDDKLHLRDGLELSRDDILEATSAPALVYLSACQSSYADAETLAGGVSLAHAFILSGAHYVIGATDDIHGEVARKFANAFYAELGRNDGRDVPRAWHQAYREVDLALAPSLKPYLRMLRLYSR